MLPPWFVRVSSRFDQNEASLRDLLGSISEEQLERLAELVSKNFDDALADSCNYQRQVLALFALHGFTCAVFSMAKKHLEDAEECDEP